MKAFVAYAAPLWDEKGHAQVFCERLFQAFGHAGYHEAGATLEARVPKHGAKGKKFIDLVWKPIVLIEMKKASEKLHLHYQQAFDYWIAAVPDRPRYVVLCNFKEFWIYDFDKQLDEPVDKVKLDELPYRYTALNFLFPDNPRPIFNNDREDVSRRAADQMADLYRRLVKRVKNPASREQAQRFVLQLIVAMFAEDVDLLPASIVKTIVDDCIEKGLSAYDLFGGLFRQMNDPKAAAAGRFKGVPYFNGGLFSKIEPIELGREELDLIGKDNTGAATENWAKVNPAIFGTLFQDSMDQQARHALGAHFTAEADIQRIVGPTIVRPWQQRIDAATTMKQLLQLRTELSKFCVLDPACGSGNFLYVTFREMARLDLRIVQRIKDSVSSAEFSKQVRTLCIVSPKQFFGLDIDPFGVDLAKVTLALAKELALEEARETFPLDQGDLELEDEALPLDNLDENIRQADALLVEWPKVHAIVGNPPYQSKNKSQAEMEPGYLHDLRERYPDVDGRADYCTYWFRRAHDHLGPGQRAGLVGTNTIRENYSREASLDYIVSNGGEITEAMSSMPWPGDASLHVSIVNWIKGSEAGTKRLFLQEGQRGKAKERVEDLDRIGPALSFKLDVTKAKSLKANRARGCYQGQTHGHKAFLMRADQARLTIRADNTGTLSDVMKPYLIANDLLGKKGRPARYVIDFQGKDLLTAQSYPAAYKPVEHAVLPAREKAAEKEAKRNKATLEKRPQANVNRHHENFLKRWWVLSYPREDLISELDGLPRYIACGRVTKRPIFAFVDSAIRPSDALQVFAYDDDYSFGILQSDVHWEWFTSRCSTLTERFRYTSNTVWDSFPWPQQPTLPSVKKVATAAVGLRAVRAELMAKHSKSLRDLYRSIELPGAHPLKDAHAKLDAAVREAYGMTPKQKVLPFLLSLNADLAAAEAKGAPIEAPGLPAAVTNHAHFVSADALKE